MALALSGSAQTEAVSHLYALIVSGGRNRLTNHERYWNDCAFLYRTLRQRYHLPKQHVVVLMSDGGDPADDMLRTGGMGFASSPVDLDGDSIQDVFDAATGDNLLQVMTGLSRQLAADDHLFLFFIDHGGLDSQTSIPYLWLWNNEQLLPDKLGSLLDGIHAGSVSLVFGQCYAGGFLSALQREGRVIATACSGNELSWVCPDLPYDEFVYHWTCAVNGADIDGTPVDADADNDGRVSMREAYDYAYSHDRRAETPQYSSLPESLGVQWTFSGVGTGSGISELQTDASAVSVFSLSGIRQPLSAVPCHSLYIRRQGNRITKNIRP